jgi:tetratricopeptide (TPR) repeat protein
MNIDPKDGILGLGADLDIILLASVKRRNKPQLPVMPGTFMPRYGLAAHVDQQLRECDVVNKASVGGQVKLAQTLAAPITHGIAPPLDGLKEISLRHAIKYVNSIQTGCVLFVKTWKEAYRLVATALCVEDDNGDAIMLNLYNYVRPEEDPQLMFPRGTYLAVKEPYLRFSMDDPKLAAVIRTDNPQSIVVFDDERAWNAARGRMPTSAAKLVEGAVPDAAATAAKVEAYCEHGNKHFAQKRFRQALKAYSAGLLLDPCHVRCLSNRSQTFLCISSWQQALDDADAVLALELSHRKCRYRRSVALLCLQRPIDALLEIDSILSDLDAGKFFGFHVN